MVSVLSPLTLLILRVGDFRPISLINSVPKLIAKVLSLRLSAVIGSLVSPAQSAFLKTRCLQDNFLYVQNCVRSLHRKKKAALLIKLDIARAFDSVSWEYILELLTELGFSARLRDWITLLLSSSSSAFLLNGTPGDQINHRRGLRQGDPPSPLLFILAIDPLHRLISKAAMDGIIAPLPVREIKLRVSVYADDAVIFANPDRDEIDKLLHILKLFGDASGLHLNPAKSIVTPIRCEDLDLQHILANFGGQIDPK